MGAFPPRRGFERPSRPETSEAGLVTRPTPGGQAGRTDGLSSRFALRARLATPVFSLLVLVTLGILGFMGVVLFQPDSIDGLVPGIPRWMELTAVVALLPFLHIALAPIPHAALLLLVSLVATTPAVYKRRGTTPCGWRKRHQRPRLHR
jgi:uncharacterized membrane protein YhdT